MKKKLLAGILALALCSTNMPPQTIFAGEFTSGNPDVVSEEDTPEIFTNEEQEAAGETNEDLFVFSSEEAPEFNDTPDEAMAATENAQNGVIDLTEDATDKERQELDEFLKNDSQIERYTHVQFTKMSVPRNKSNISVYVYVPENLETFNKDVTLQDRKTKEKYKLTDAGTVISEKTATLTGLKVGDTMTITKDGKNYETKIAAVTENYMGHYIYMTGNVYEQIFGEKPDYSATVFTVKEEYKESESEVGNEILKHPAALSISYTSSLEAQLHRMLGALDTVIIVLIISAGMLAFVVLYNLNNVNITERQRELATLKVLGFYDTEVSAYVYRENVILTLIGVLAGAVFGIFLHRYIIRTVEVDAVMFGRNINPVSFLYCGLLTIGFSMIVNLFMHQKLKKIDMVESLKSVE